MLAIAAPGFHDQTETFIRDHVRHLAPGRTVLICSDAKQAAELGCPLLAGVDIDVWKAPHSLLERVGHAFRYRYYLRRGICRQDRRKVLTFFREHEVKEVLCEYGPTGCLVADTCHSVEMPFYVYFHGYDASILIRDRKWIPLYRDLFKKATGIVAPSRFLADKLSKIGCPDYKLHVVPCGVDSERFRPTRRRRLRILAVSRLTEKKAPHITIEAFGRLIKKFPLAELDVIGDGPLMGQCRGLAQELGLNERIRFHGWQPSEFVAALMGEASLFVQHSVTAANGDSEGLPVAILEAMASALPVVSTRHSGIPEAVIDGETGILTNERDVIAMAAGMSELLERPARAMAMGEAGRLRVLKYFSVEKSRDRLRAIMRLGYPSQRPEQTVKDCRQSDHDRDSCA
jgi:colanic acid/amylovoran biosynthesis glycosyltransferase